MEIHSDVEKAPFEKLAQFFFISLLDIMGFGFIIGHMNSSFVSFFSFPLYPSKLDFLVDQKANNRRTRANHEIFNEIILYEERTSKYLYAC